MTRRRYTNADKATAVGAAEVMGIRPAAASLGIPESTLRRWREEPEMAQLRAEKREDVAADVWAGFQLGVRRTIDLMKTSEDLGKVAIATGVLHDKYALLSGMATSRTESKALIDDDKREQVRDFIVSLPANARAPRPSSN